MSSKLRRCRRRKCESDILDRYKGSAVDSKNKPTRLKPYTVHRTSPVVEVIALRLPPIFQLSLPSTALLEAKISALYIELFVNIRTEANMAWVHRGICLLLLALTVAEAVKNCPPSARISWIPSPGGIDVMNPWDVYPAPESHCCDAVDPQTPFNAQEKCSLCYNLTKSTPGFAADPNNCQNFYMCEPNGQGGWNTFLKTCPACTFWDQDKLTCVEVYQDLTLSGVCGNFTAVTGIPITTHDMNRKLFCINFEKQYELTDSGYYVFNDGVDLVNGAMCPVAGSQCGHFLGSNSRLEIPFFSNNYDGFPSLRITMYIRMTGGGPGDVQGVISNDCGPNGMVPNAAGNSLYCSVNGTIMTGGLKDPAVDIATDVTGAAVVYAEMTWTGTMFSVVLKKDDQFGVVLDAQPAVPFNGPIRNSHCPLVIGSFIKQAVGSYFEGYMDDVSTP
ncbi:hypothetical protein LSAT2_012716 [Lamellibrachia satsuma]|nr:hypothetical protein LSAT2_012716 [Lamellibrachia satsuma]